MKIYFKPWLTVSALALVVLVMMMTTSQPSHAAGPWYVAPGGDDSNNCLNPGTACASINGAIGKASPGDTIYIATGTYTGTGNEVVLVDMDVILSGGWDGTFTTQSGTSTINGQNSRRGITVNGGVTAIVERFTVQNGFADTGGGIYSYGGILTLSNSTITSNTATSDGGGLYLYISDSTLNSNTITSNTSNSCGGGLAIYVSGVTLNGNTIASNTAEVGGGVCLAYSYSSITTFHDNTFASNIANGPGGGLFLYFSPAAFSKNIIISNTSNSSGGGLYLADGSDAMLTNTVIADNSASMLGGGLYVRSSSPELLHTSIARNTGSDGSGIYVTGNEPAGWGFSTVAMTNTILASHTVGTTVTANSNNTVILDGVLWHGNATNYGGMGIITITNAITGDPAFAADGYHIILASAAIDAGVDAGVTTDIDGHHRPHGSAPDLGADEFVSGGSLEVTIDIKPGSDPNSINCNNQKGVIAVAILTTQDFDATTVDHTTVTFEGASETHVDKNSGEPRRHEEDVDYDGDTDLIFHFRLGDTSLTCDSTEGTLMGETFDGQAIESSDAVRMISGGNKQQ